MSGRKVFSGQRMVAVGVAAAVVVFGGGAAISPAVQRLDGWIGAHSWVLAVALLPLAYHWSRRRLQLAAAASQSRFGSLGLTLAEPAGARRGPLLLTGEVGGHPAEVSVTQDDVDVLQRTVVRTGVPAAFVAAGGNAGWRAVAGIVPHALLVQPAGDGSVTVRADATSITVERRLPGRKRVDATGPVQADLDLAELVLAAARPRVGQAAPSPEPARSDAGQAV